MDIATLKAVMAATPNTHTIMLKGPHGIGKTEVIRWLAKNVWHQDCVEFQASQISDVGDLIGLPRINAETGETEFVPPYWYKKDKDGNPLPVTLFLDEINRGNLSNVFGETFTLLERDYRDYDFSDCFNVDTNSEEYKQIRDKIQQIMLNNLWPKMHWVEDTSSHVFPVKYYCSNCGNDELYKTPFCPQCYAMEVKDD